MVFSSSTFLLAFLPLFILVYFVAPPRPAKNIILLLASLVFYAWGEPVYLVLMLVSIAANWGFAILIAARPGRARLWMVLDLVFNLAVLCFFKYEGFLAGNINFLVGFDLVPDLDLPLPIGISFYTLQAVSYVIDVYRGKVAPQRNILYLGMYIAMFPQLVAGPIVRYETIQDQILNRKENLKDFAAGVRLFTIGLAKKVLLANVVAILAADMLAQGGASIGMIGAWAGLLAYTFQIFFDFAGYSDMAIGLGKMFGFQYQRNFNYPYISTSISEFWRRWHISLSSFFRDYVYISLGGNRVKKPRWIFNLSVVWVLTGIWHGAAWNFVLWGLFNLAFLLLEKFVWGDALAKTPKIVQHVYTILIFMLGWLLFWIEDMSIMAEYFCALFGAYGVLGASTFWELQAWSYVPIFVACIAASTPIVPWLRAQLVAFAQGGKLEGFFKADLPNPKMLSTKTLCDYSFYLSEADRGGSGRSGLVHVVFALADIVLLGFLVLSVFSVVSGSFNPFIYFRF